MCALGAGCHWVLPLPWCPAFALGTWVTRAAAMLSAIGGSARLSGVCALELALWSEGAGATGHQVLLAFAAQNMQFKLLFRLGSMVAYFVSIFLAV